MTRVLSAVVLLPLVVGAIWFLPPAGTLVLAEIAAVLAFLEYAGLAAAHGARVPRAVAGAGVAAVCAAFGLAYVPVDVVLISALIAVGAIAVASGEPGAGVLRDVTAALFPLLYIGLPLGVIAAVHTIAGREAVLLLLGTLVISDTAQYYTGRALGRTKLAPVISPGKTREGAVGGVLFGTLVMTLGSMRVFPSARPGLVVVPAAVVLILGIVGDLFESLLKRSAGVKDSSHIIPGHGGVLDRIDSWLFAGPAYYLFVRYLQA
jgi:phosphatidate cytidylyltransferase